ncbi:glycosyltransferase [Flagellimonas sp. S3867]|uniref:glycosyltransferase n=1 Tax=Flagellimonas sp. S3867 TaxID=2768063 RepID=UPI00168465A1|nr:glycosyltransferase [Flagellimonas sp. S3867]
MRVLLISVGTRGDIEPFLTIAEMLRQKGHNTICCFPEQFREMVTKSDIEFLGLNSKFLELLDSRAGKIAMGGKASILEKTKAYYHLYKKSSIINKTLIKQQHKFIQEINPDKVIYNIKSIYPLAWSVENMQKTILVSPIPYLIHYTKNHGHIGFNRNYGLFFNRITYTLANFAFIRNVKSVMNEIPRYRDVGHRQLKKILSSTPMLFTVAPAIIPRPDYWKENVQVVGYPEKPQKQSKLPYDLETFFAKHKKVLFITFGSMVNEAPEEKTRLIVNLLEDYHIPAIINTASNGLIETESYNPELIKFVHGIPYNAVFPKVHAVVHHGGAGTTHLGLKHGCSSLIIPHIIDQFLWQNIIYNLGVGPKGIAIKKMNRQNLEPRLLDLFQNNVYKERAKQVSEEMMEERNSDSLYKFIVN